MNPPNPKPNIYSALPILRELGAQNSGSIIQSMRQGDTSMLKVWVGLEARKFVQASIKDVSLLALILSYLYQEYST